MITRPLPRTANGWLATLVGSGGHHRRDLRENRADAGRNARHNGAGGNGHETCHQSVLDEVLTARVFPNFQLQNQIFHCLLVISSSVWCATGPCRYRKFIIGRLQKESGVKPNESSEKSQPP